MLCTRRRSFRYWPVFSMIEKKGKTPQIPSVSIFCNPRTVELTCTFQEQLIVVKSWLLVAWNKNSISQAGQKNLSCWEQHKTILVVSLTSQNWPKWGLKIHHSRATQNYWFSAGLVNLLSYRCHMSPGFAPIVYILKQHEIEHSIKKQHEILKSKIQSVIIIICICRQHKILK